MTLVVLLSTDECEAPARCAGRSGGGDADGSGGGEGVEVPWRRRRRRRPEGGGDEVTVDFEWPAAGGVAVGDSFQGGGVGDPCGRAVQDEVEVGQ